MDMVTPKLKQNKINEEKKGEEELCPGLFSFTYLTKGNEKGRW